MKYRVEADSEAEAVVMLLEGEAEPVGQSPEHIEVAEDYGLPVGEFPALAKALSDLNVSVGESIIPSIRSIDVVQPRPCNPAELAAEPPEADVGEAVSEETQCADSPTGRHMPDPKSVRPADGAGRNRGTDWLIDVNCLHCGRSGSMRIDPNDLQW